MVRLFARNFGVLEGRHLSLTEWSTPPCVFRSWESVAMEYTQKHVITGIIMPHSWDKNGKVDAVALYTDKEDVYEFEDSRLSQALTRFIQMTVEINGQIREHPDGNKSIAAQNYRVLE